jgi:hypothetical protein
MKGEYYCDAWQYALFRTTVQCDYGGRNEKLEHAGETSLKAQACFQDNIKMDLKEVIFVV